MTTNKPAITVIIPTLNERGFIADCLHSVLANTYPKSALEILVVDGGSTDGTLQEVSDFIESNSIIRLLHNPKKIVPSALNLGIAAANHDLVIWLGAHAIYDKHYLSRSVNVLLEENCASAGGVISPIGKTTVGKAIAAATSTKFGVGNAKYRSAKTRQSVDTVFGGCWRKADILKIGGFDENWVRNQDYELNCRLREQVGEIILDPEIRFQYFCRESIPALAKQYFNYGYWRFNTFLKHPASFTVRQAAPLALLLGLLASVGLAIVGSSFAVIIPAFYLSTSMVISILLTIRDAKPIYLILVPLIFATLHFAWAVGFVTGMVTKLLSTASGKGRHS